MDIIQITNIYIHVIVGSLLLLLGLIPLVALKGSEKHMYYGRLYIYLYGIVLATAIIGVVFFRSPPALMAITYTAFYGYLSGVRALKIKNCGPTLIDNFISLAAITIGLLMLVVMSKNGTSSWSPVIGYSVIGVTITYAIYDLSRNLWRSLWKERIWPIDHGVKIVGSYFALASAASGNLLREFQPWSQITPSAIGTILSIFFVYLHFKRRKILYNKVNHASTNPTG